MRRSPAKIFWQLGLMLFILVLVSYGWSFLNASQHKKVGQIIRPPHEVSALAANGSTVYAGGQEGVFLIDPRSARVMGKLNRKPNFEYVRDLLIDKSGTLWIAHNKGLTSFNGKDYRDYTEESGLPDSRVNCLYQDRQGRLWVGTWGGAACKEGGGWRTLTRRNGLVDNMVNCIMEDSRGGMWFGSYARPNGGVSYFNGQKWSYLTAKNGLLPDANVTTIVENHRGNILIGTGFVDQGGLVEVGVRPNGLIEIIRIMTTRDGLAGAKVRSIFEESRQVLWVGSEYDGAARFEGGEVQILTTANGLSGNEVKEWLKDGDGNLWLATNDGVTFIQRNELAGL